MSREKDRPERAKHSTGPNRRQKMVASEIFEVISLTIIEALEDPRVQGISVSHVEMSPDLRLAKVYVTSGRPNFNMKQALGVLDRAKTFLRQEIAKELNMKRVPELAFFQDDILGEAWKMDTILSDLNDKPSGE
ncbi:30S ribosome-binding factor RbfA [Myxococcota bacterium]|nr:30S ribosome-binding factor RbfA [Myxococcota bacterium]MBU1379486.1 30S ribosome-binding factor RbfA [Myxococcota bacterium]MBU1497917.1 30S ribosome-binding factor RbfA [Myxococcota bacterium]